MELTTSMERGLSWRGGARGGERLKGLLEGRPGGELHREGLALLQNAGLHAERRQTQPNGGNSWTGPVGGVEREQWRQGRHILPLEELTM